MCDYLPELYSASQWGGIPQLLFVLRIMVPVLLPREMARMNEATLSMSVSVSDAVVCEMAVGVLQQLGGDVAVAISGIVGPDEAQPGKLVGKV